MPVTPRWAAAALIDSTQPAWARPVTHGVNAGAAVAPTASARPTSWSSFQVRVWLANRPA